MGNSNQEIKALYEKFDKEYDFIYKAEETGSYIAGYDEAVVAFDAMLKAGGKVKEICQKFVEYRQDYISSDREAAAFMFAIESLGY